MGAQESKRWVELPSETPERQHKRVGQLKELQDPRSPATAPRTPIQMQEYDESPQNRELKIDIPDPRSPDPLIDRTPIVIKSRKNSKLSKKPSTQEAAVEIIEYLPLKEDRKMPHGTTEAISPAAVLSNKEQARLLKKTISPGDYRRQRRVSQRQSVPQKLFTELGAPAAPRSPLTQRNSIDQGEAELKKAVQLATNYGSHHNELGSGKENAAMNVVF